MNFMMLLAVFSCLLYCTAALESPNFQLKSRLVPMFKGKRGAFSTFAGPSIALHFDGGFGSHSNRYSSIPSIPAYIPAPSTHYTHSLNSGDWKSIFNNGVPKFQEPPHLKNFGPVTFSGSSAPENSYDGLIQSYVPSKLQAANTPGLSHYSNTKLSLSLPATTYGTPSHSSKPLFTPNAERYQMALLVPSGSYGTPDSLYMLPSGSHGGLNSIAYEVPSPVGLSMHGANLVSGGYSFGGSLSSGNTHSLTNQEPPSKNPPINFNGPPSVSSYETKEKNPEIIYSGPPSSHQQPSYQSQEPYRAPGISQLASYIIPSSETHGTSTHSSSSALSSSQEAPHSHSESLSDFSQSPLDFSQSSGLQSYSTSGISYSFPTSSQSVTYLPSSSTTYESEPFNNYGHPSNSPAHVNENSNPSSLPESSPQQHSFSTSASYSATNEQPPSFAALVAEQPYDSNSQVSYQEQSNSQDYQQIPSISYGAPSSQPSGNYQQLAFFSSSSKVPSQHLNKPSNVYGSPNQSSNAQIYESHAMPSLSSLKALSKPSVSYLGPSSPYEPSGSSSVYNTIKYSSPSQSKGYKP